MPANDSTPVVIGIGFSDQRDFDVDKMREPFDLMLDSIQAAAKDAGAPSLLSRVSSMRVVKGVWPYTDPGRALAEAVGSPQAESVMTAFSGTMIHVSIRDACQEILRGERDIVVVTGAECGYTRAKARKQGFKPELRDLPGTPDRFFGPELEMTHVAEEEIDLTRPTEMYAIFENALRYRDGLTVDQHLDRLGELGADFSRVAAGNPHAWLREPKSAREISRPGPGNRPVSFPYPLLLNSNSRVDQGGAVILCSLGTAKQLGVPESKWVFPRVSTEANDILFASERDCFYQSPAVRLASQKLFELAGIDVGDLSHIDLYSCFPSAVQIAANELGLRDGVSRTVTGGMTFGGGPLNCFVIRSTARLIELLRENPGDLGLVTGNGGFVSKHAFTIYSTEPSPDGFQYANVQDQVDALPRRAVSQGWSGECEIESYTVMYRTADPDRALAALRRPDGSRGWGISRDPDLMQAMTQQEFCGRHARRTMDAGFEVL